MRLAEKVRLIEPNNKTRYFNRESEHLAAIDGRSVDVAVLCNVLHEIDPAEWLRLFSKTGLLGRLVRPDGHILIIEDQRIRVGEKALSSGFHLLDRAQFCCLFDLRENEDYQIQDERDDGRLKAHLIPAAFAARVSGATIREALENLQQCTKEEIRRIRQLPASYANGTLHGLWVQLYANCALTLETWHA